MRLTAKTRTGYVFTGLPLAALGTSLMLWRLTPALDHLLGNTWRASSFDEYQVFLIVVLIAAQIGSIVLGSRRAQQLGRTRPAAWGALTALPLIGFGVACWLALASPEEETAESGAWALAGRLILPALFGSAAIAALGGGIQWLAFQVCDIDWLLTPLMGWTPLVWLGIPTMFGVPLAIAGTAGFLSGQAGGGRLSAIGAASYTLLGVLMIIGFAMVEGVVCIVMALPFVAVIATLGALAGHWLATRTQLSATRMQCAAWLLVAAMGVGEAAAPRSSLEDTVNSTIIVDATPARVWAELQDIRDLPPPSEPLFVLGVAHPVGTTLEAGGGVGARRSCQLSTGEMPEVVTVWKPGEELRFAVLDTPPPMREAAIFGREIDAPHLHGTYASLEGGFRLEALPDGRTRLTGTSRYLLRLSPAPYWNLWTREIVSQVQLRVLRHVKTRAEAK